MWLVAYLLIVTLFSYWLRNRNNTTTCYCGYDVHKNICHFSTPSLRIDKRLR
ncbi:type I toxin-antitoxin system Fst family toxin, partial [Staphylococcus haemolyticus]